MPKATQQAPLNMAEQQLHSEPLLDIRTPNPISKAEAGHAVKETHFGLVWKEPELA